MGKEIRSLFNFVQQTLTQLEADHEFQTSDAMSTPSRKDSAFFRLAVLAKDMRNVGPSYEFPGLQELPIGVVSA